MKKHEDEIGQCYALQINERRFIEFTIKESQKHENVAHDSDHREEWEHICGHDENPAAGILLRKTEMRSKLVSSQQR